MARSDDEEILEVTRRLVAYRTTADRPEQLKACMAFITGYFDGSGASLRHFTWNGKPALFVSFDGRKEQEIILNGHIDVVEGHETQFTARRDGERLYGRGTYDMKGAVAVFMLVMKRLARKRRPPKVGLMLVSDEEIGSRNGTKRFVARGYRAKMVIAGEPTRLQLETKHKGALQVRLTAYGSSGHASRPWLGNNAVDKLIKQYQKLRDELPQATRKQKWLPSVNITNFLCTGAYNVTPSKAECVLDIRTNEEVTNRKVLQLIGQLNVKCEKILDSSMLLNPKKDIHIRRLREIAERRLGRRVKYIKSAGGSDMHFFSSRGMTAVNFGPKGKGHHKGNEHVLVDSLIDYYHIILRYAEADA